VAILTGGVSGVPEAVSHSFWQQRREQGEEKPPVFHIQPAGFTPWDYGENLTAGYTLEQRRWILAHLAPVYLLLEGGPGAAQEVRWALAAGAIAIPVGCTGGFAGSLYDELRYSQWVVSEDVEAAWAKIGDPVPPLFKGGLGGDRSVAEIATAILLLLQKALDLKAKRLDRSEIEAQLARDNRNFPGCWIENTNLDRLKLRGVNFRWAMFKQVNFGQTDLSEANLRGSLISDCRFERAIVTQTQFNYAHFVRTTFANMDLPTADFTATCCWASSFRESVTALLDKLEIALKSARWHRGNQLTLRLLFALTGGVEKNDGETFNPELPGRLPYNRLEISQKELLAIDFLWFRYSQGRFGFSVQAHIWRSLLAKETDNIYIDIDKAFADRVGRPQFLPVYQADRAKFSLDCPVGHLPWLNWTDAETGTLCGLMGGGRGRDLIFFLEPQLPAGLEAFVFGSAIAPKGDRKLESIGDTSFRNRLINCQKILQPHNLPPRILIVDDSITVRHLLSITFTKAGYRIITARDGQEAWELLQAGFVCDLILSNIEMPRMDGLELLQKLKQDDRLQKIPIAMITSRGEEKMRPVPLWQSLGAVACFRKPYVEKELLDFAAQILRKS
jgi:CheY-like chemotaxis protein